MATVQTGFQGGSMGGVTKSSTPGQPPIRVVAIGDGEGNLATITNGGLNMNGGSTASSPQTVQTVPSGSQSPSQTGLSFSTSGIAAMAVDITLSGFTGGIAPTLIPFLDRQGSDGQWYRIWTGVAMGAAGVQSVTVGQVASVLSGLLSIPALLTSTARFGWTCTGAPTAVSFSASIVGR